MECLPASASAPARAARSDSLIGVQHRRITLKAGITRKQAEQEWKKIIGKVAAGQDPQGDKKTARATASIGTFKAIADDFLAHQEVEKKRIVTQAPPTSVHGEVLKFVRERLDARTDKVELTAAMLRATKALMEQVSSIRLFARCDQD